MLNNKPVHFLQIMAQNAKKKKIEELFEANLKNLLQYDKMIRKVNFLKSLSHVQKQDEGPAAAEKAQRDETVY